MKSQSIRRKLLLFVLLIFAVCVPVSAETLVAGGPIIMDKTWNLAGSPYILNGSIVVGFDATLTIEAGVEVRIKPAIGLTIGSADFGDGTLVAQGTAENPIIFTSIKDPNDP
ncbi:MAG: hypothetical protein KAS23_04145, partial [Anaerohalosphaera sp.]|nr:hypothetical protein [Anaerohalosphaera sp.]